MTDETKKAGIIVSRHPAAIEFIKKEIERRYGKDRAEVTPVLESATQDDVRGQVVWGNLPLGLARLAEEVRAVEFVGSHPRGQEYDIREMEAAGAMIYRYRVRDMGFIGGPYFDPLKQD